MSWWPFKRKTTVFKDDLHIRGTRVWIQDLREVCERHFDNHVEGQRLVREMQIEWTDAHTSGDVNDALLEGLDRRALRLLRADNSEWLKWLDEEDFWMPGWREENKEDVD